MVFKGAGFDSRLNSHANLSSLSVILARRTFVKWLFQNFGNRAGFALRNPRYAAAALFRELTRVDEKFLARIAGSSVSQIRAYLNEPISTPEFADRLRAAQNEFRDLAITSADLYAKKVLYQYAAVRALKPECIVETGIANGVSSAYLLLALQKNARGFLHSIGLAERKFLPPGNQPGWLVPKWLRSRWQIHLGDAREVLPRLMMQIEGVDIFIHDSLHTYEHMLWEFEAAYPYMRSGALLCADDALWNDAFNDFARKVEARDARILHGVGFLRKLTE
jgi:predicted O-methyltransferase YrrM